MNTAIIYESKHHGNTKKLLDFIAQEEDVTLIDAAEVSSFDLSAFERIGFASGVYFQKFGEGVARAARENLPEGKQAFLIYTSGSKGEAPVRDMEKILRARGAKTLGAFGCRGYDTFGPFKLVGGIAKGRPNEEDLKDALKFYRELGGAEK